MENHMATAIVSAVIAGVFTLLGKLFEARLKTTSASTTNAVPGGTVMSTPSTTTVTRSPSQFYTTFSFGRVLIHVAVLQLVANLVGVIVGALLGASTKESLDTFLGTILLVSLIVGTVVLTIGFTWSGLKVAKAIRWKHLSYVAIGTALSTVFIGFLLSAPVSLEVLPEALFIAFIQTFLAMWIGGAVANAMREA